MPTPATAPIVRRLDHTAVFVRDLDHSIAWYEQTLGLTCAYQGDTGNNIPGAFFDVGDTILAMLISADPHRNLAEQHFAFAVEDADAVHADLVARGLSPESPPTDLPAGYIAGQRSFELLDPDGVRIEFVQRRNISINPRTLHPAESEPRPAAAEHPAESEPRPAAAEHPAESEPHPAAAEHPAESEPHPAAAEHPAESDLAPVN